MVRIESLLSGRLFLRPQLVEDRLYFISNLSGRLSLYAMDLGGSVPEPLLPPDIALQNPHLLDGESFCVLPRLGKILVMIDHDGDENYQPCLIPLAGGYPEPAFGEQLADYRVHLFRCDPERSLAYFSAEARHAQMLAAFRGDLRTCALELLGQSPWGCYVAGVSGDHSHVILIDIFLTGDHVVYLWKKGTGPEGRKLLYGTPREQRSPGQAVTLNAINHCHFTPRHRGLLFTTALFSDAFGLGYFRLNHPEAVKPVTVTGAALVAVAGAAPVTVAGAALGDAAGELVGLKHVDGPRYLVEYNRDGCSWLYEGIFDESTLTMKLGAVVCGQGQLTSGVLESVHFDRASSRYALAFSSATSPTQLYVVSGARRKTVKAQTRERVLGIPAGLLSPGEPAPFTTFDGLRVSARLYLPASALGFQGPRPLVYYVHGGPQSQERPDFAWFSMPLIQFLTLNGFAVFVPNVRGSEGYGLSFVKKVDRDWGGGDRLDHVHALKVLAADPRLDVKRAGVVGRSYGGYMSLMLAARHPELWSAAVDMFGPYDLLSFSERIPESWKPYFRDSIGDPADEKDRAFLAERSPRTYIHQIACPLLVIQGHNDPRVIEQESRDVVDHLRALGKPAEILVFENEGHDVLKFENRVRCYNAITEFFRQNLRP
jgi:pimeloyl-ACP methyl ester carboxylesterase